MLWGVVLFVSWIALEAVVVLGSVIWSVEEGQWKNIEISKYTMLEDQEPQDWPGRKPLAPRPPKKIKVQPSGSPVKG